MPYAKGHIRRPDKDHLIALSHHRHMTMLNAKRAIPTPPSWDSRTLGWVNPIKDQEQCGSCWDFSGTGVVEIAYLKSGRPIVLSEEYTLSCGDNGGCNGDDNVTVLEAAKANGLPKDADYGSYGPYNDPNACNIPACAWQPAMPLFKISDWGFASGAPGQNLPSVDAIKSAIMHYGAVGAAIAADDAFQGIQPGTVFQDSGATQIDHDIILVGWDDAKGAWLLRNSWTTQWADQGYCWIAYGANQVGTEAVWCEAATAG